MRFSAAAIELEVDVETLTEWTAVCDLSGVTHGLSPRLDTKHWGFMALVRFWLLEGVTWLFYWALAP
jgi:hypothetical protein